LWEDVSDVEKEYSGEREDFDVQNVVYILVLSVIKNLKADVQCVE